MNFVENINININDSSNSMKRYLLFAGFYCYPEGGLYDFIDSFDELEPLINKIKELTKPGYSHDWWNVLDLVSGTKVFNDLELLKKLS